MAATFLSEASSVADPHHSSTEERTPHHIFTLYIVSAKIYLQSLVILELEKANSLSAGGGPFLGTAQAGPALAVWHVACGGAASASTCLEVPSALAQCLSLPDGISVMVRLLLASDQMPLQGHAPT